MMRTVYTVWPLRELASKPGSLPGYTVSGSTTPARFHFHNLSHSVQLKLGVQHSPRLNHSFPIEVSWAPNRNLTSSVSGSLQWARCMSHTTQKIQVILHQGSQTFLASKRHLAAFIQINSVSRFKIMSLVSALVFCQLGSCRCFTQQWGFYSTRRQRKAAGNAKLVPNYNKLNQRTYMYTRENLTNYTPASLVTF